MSTAEHAVPNLLAKNEFQQQMHELYHHHHSWLLTWLSSKTGCIHQAADLSQDTFVRVLSKQQLLDLHEPRAFLTTIAKRVLANHWRRDQLEHAYLEALANAPQEYQPSEEERAILFEALYEIDRILDGLPILVKRAFLLAQLDGMRQAEIAQALGISVTTVKRYLVRANAQCFFAISVDE